MFGSFVLCYLTGRFVSFFFSCVLWVCTCKIRPMDWNLRSFVPKVHLNEFDHKVQCMCACALWPLLVEESSSNDLLHAGLKIWILSLQGHSENRAQDVPERANGGWGGNKDMERATNNPSMELFHDTIALYPTKGLEEYTRFLVTTN